MTDLPTPEQIAGDLVDGTVPGDPSMPIFLYRGVIPPDEISDNGIAHVLSLTPSAYKALIAAALTAYGDRRAREATKTEQKRMRKMAIGLASSFDVAAREARSVTAWESESEAKGARNAMLDFARFIRET